MVRSRAVKVPQSKGETVKRRLRRLGILKGYLLPKKSNDSIFLPIEDGVYSTGYDIIEMDFEERKKRPKSYKEIANLPEKLKGFLPNSYDVVGDIALIKIPEELIQYRGEIGNAILRVHKNITVVCLSKPVTGEYRTRDVEIIAGEKRTTTVHKEYGVELHVDVKETFFSPRLAGERFRVAHLVKKNETVVDMFAGVAPFSIMIAKYGPPNIVYAIDKNQVAVELARKNVVRNRVVDKVEVVLGDAEEVVNGLVQKNVKADRIIMNLPFLAHGFFTNALSAAENGCIIHYYDVLKKEEINNRIRFLEKVAQDSNKNIDVGGIRMIKTYAPREFYTCFDIRVTGMPA
ncbi:MAG TPA: class I SAM-dependent methyltransferase family protein [Thermoplasmata archaeon]|nr:class I SAM-dependent methyltransferase family protein [Thermoplasmata archaeon]